MPLSPRPFTTRVPLGVVRTTGTAVGLGLGVDVGCGVGVDVGRGVAVGKGVSVGVAVGGGGLGWAARTSGVGVVVADRTDAAAALAPRGNDRR